MLEQLTSQQKVTGLKQSQRAVTEGKAKHAFVALDAEKRVTATFCELCAEHNVPVTNVESMKELGRLCGIEVSAAVAVLLN